MLTLRALRYALAAGVALLGGCQTYSPMPLHVSGYQDSWRVRRPDDPGVAAFVRKLNVSAAQPAAFDVADGLSLAEAEAVALMFNPDLRIARRRAGVVQARAANAGRWADPVVGVDAERIVSGVQSPWVVAGTVSLTIPISGRLEIEKQRASAEHVVELTRIAAAEWATRQRLRELWTAWSVEKMKLALLDDVVKKLDSLNALAQRLVVAEALTRIEARVFLIEKSQRQTERIAAETRLEELRLQLHALLGLVPRAAVELVSQVDAPAIPAGEPGLDGNLAVRIAQAEHEVAERHLEREVRTQYPDLTIGPGFGTDQGDARALLGISLPLPLWNRNVQNAAEAFAARQLAREQVEAAVEGQTSALEQARAQLQGAAARRRLLESTIVGAVDEQAAEAQRVADLGEVDALLLLDAVLRQHEAKAQVLDARLDEIRALIRLHELIGPPTEPAK